MANTMAAIRSHIEVQGTIDYTPSELAIQAKALYKELAKLNFQQGDNMQLEGNKYQINFLHENKHQKLFQLSGSNFTFNVFMAVGKVSGEVVVTHSKNKMELQRDLIPMTERLFKGLNDNIKRHSIDRGVEEHPIVKIPTKQSTPGKQAELKPLTQLKVIPSAIGMSKKSIADEVKSKSELLTDFSKELMVTAEVTFESKPNKKHFAKEEYKVKVFGKDNNKKFKDDVQETSKLLLKTILSYSKYIIIGAIIIQVLFKLKEHYIK